MQCESWVAVVDSLSLLYAFDYAQCLSLQQICGDKIWVGLPVHYHQQGKTNVTEKRERRPLSTICKALMACGSISTDQICGSWEVECHFLQTLGQSIAPFSAGTLGRPILWNSYQQFAVRAIVPQDHACFPGCMQWFKTNYVINIFDRRGSHLPVSLSMATSDITQLVARAHASQATPAPAH